MMRTWGYIKEAVLAKMDLTSEQANEYGMLNKIPFYANAAITEISGIKPNRKYVVKTVLDRSTMVANLATKYWLDRVDFLGNSNITDAMLSEKSLAARRKYDRYDYVNYAVTMPDDFYTWNEDPMYREVDVVIPQRRVSIPGVDANKVSMERVTEKLYYSYGNNKIIFLEAGIYHIPYSARWFEFWGTMDDSTKIDVPDDILECLPSYIAAQLFKIDDEEKSSIYRNEYEMALSRIDDNMYANNKIIEDGSNW